MTLSLLCVREYGCISETHREEEDRSREGGRRGGDREITWFTYIYSLQKEKREEGKKSQFSASGKASSVHFSLAISSKVFNSLTNGSATACQKQKCVTSAVILTVVHANFVSFLRILFL